MKDAKSLLTVLSKKRVDRVNDKRPLTIIMKGVIVKGSTELRNKQQVLITAASAAFFLKTFHENKTSGVSLKNR